MATALLTTSQAPCAPVAAPPPPPPVPAGIRRRPALLGSLAAIVAAPAIDAAMAAPHPDSELLELCRQYLTLLDRLHRSYEGVPEGATIAEERAYDAVNVEPLWQRREVLLEQIQRLRSRTIDGLFARIEVLSKESPHLLSEQDGIDEILISGILLDGLALRQGSGA